MDWGRVLAATGSAVRGISDAAIINDWLEKDDESAFTGIVTQVGTSSTEEVDRLDAALLSFAATNSDAEARRRLVKFYAIFKVAEIQHHRKFRGFPP